MNKNLDLIEHRLRTLFEEDLIAIFIGKRQNPPLIDDLIQSMRININNKASNELLSPNIFNIHVSSADYDDWTLHQSVLDEIAGSLFSLGVSEGFNFKDQPSISITDDPAVKQGTYRITAKFSPSTEPMKDTTSVTKPEQIDFTGTFPKNAFLVINGKENFPIDKFVFNIGRHSDNDLLLDDPYISRHHAQLRAVNQQFVIFDVGSKGGIFVNGRKIIQSTLQTGDVIQVGATHLIYIQDSTSHHYTTTMPADDGDYPQGSHTK